MIMKNSNSQQNPNLDSEQQESKPTLLLVDDEESILASLKRLLRRKYKILSTTDGIEALSILQENANNIDVIISNPPYFKTKEDNKGLNNFKAIAKHEGELTLKLLVDSIERNLKDNGTLYFLFLSQRLDEVLMELRRKHLIPKIIKFVFDKEKKYSNVFLVKAIKNGKPGLVVEKPIQIER